MGLQRYRADEPHDPYSDGAVPWYTRWIGGPSLALIRNCKTPMGRRTVYITGEPDTFFSQPAAIKFKGRDVRGWIGFEDGVPEFHPGRWTWVHPHVEAPDAR